MKEKTSATKVIYRHEVLDDLVVNLEETRMSKTPVYHSFIIGVVVLLSGCSTTFEVEKVPETLPRVLTDPGIYYWLPLTEIDIGFVGVLTSTSNGKLGDKYRKAAIYCKDNPGKKYDGYKVRTNLEFTPKQPVISTRSVRDSRYGYRLNVDFSKFSSFSHKLTMSKDGVMQAADSTVTNTGADIALKTTAAMRDVVMKLTGVLELSKPTEKIACQAVNEVVSEKADIESTIRNLEKQKHDLLFGKGLTANDVGLAKALEYIDSKLSRKGKQLKRIDERWVTGTKENRKVELVTTVIPEEFRDLDLVLDDRTNWVFRPVGDEGDAVSDEAVIDLEDEMQKMIKNLSIKVSVRTQLQLQSNCQGAQDPKKDDCEVMASDKDLKGFRYRIPAKAEVRLIKGGSTVAKTTTYVAQYGPIASLPDTVKGLSGNIVFSLDGDTAGILSVTVGATPLPGSTPTDIINLAGDAALKKRAAKKAKEEEKRNQEANALERENNLLKLKKENLELKAALQGLDSED